MTRNIRKARDEMVEQIRKRRGREFDALCSRRKLAKCRRNVNGHWHGHLPATAGLPAKVDFPADVASAKAPDIARSKSARRGRIGSLSSNRPESASVVFRPLPVLQMTVVSPGAMRSEERRV